MRTRDKHFLYVEILLVVFAFAGCLLSVWVSWHWNSKTAFELASFRNRCDSAEKACADALSAARHLADVATIAPQVNSVSNYNPKAPIRIEGYGQSKTSKRRFIYRDVRLADGTLKRDVLQYFPLD